MGNRHVIMALLVYVIIKLKKKLLLLFLLVSESWFFCHTNKLFGKNPWNFSCGSNLLVQ